MCNCNPYNINATPCNCRYCVEPGSTGLDDKIYEFSDYEDTAHETAKYPGTDATMNIEDILQQMPTLLGLMYVGLKLPGEAGEFSNKLGKVLRDHHGVVTPEVREALLDELGDVLWYVAAAVHELDSELGIIAARNIKKLHSRMKRGVIGGSGDNR